jgi:hypothetical protein
MTPILSGGSLLQDIQVQLANYSPNRDAPPAPHGGGAAADGHRGDTPDEDALALLASRLKTPPQLVQYLTSALEEAYRIGERPATRALVESVLSRHIDDIEPRLTRHGDNVRVLAEQFSAKPAEIRQLLRGELNAARAQELTQRMIAAGLPL